MLEKLPAPDHVIAIHLSDKMTAADIARYRETFEDKLARHERVSACFDFTGVSDLSGDALVAGIKADLEFLRHVDRIDRLAFVSDKEWPQAIVRFIDPLFPTVQMKVFASSQRGAAIEWASVHTGIPKAAEPAIRFLPTSRDNVLAFEIDGMITAEEMPAVIEEIESLFADHDRVRLLNRMTDFGGVDPAIFLQQGLVSMKLVALGKVERYAIVGAPDWMNRLIETMNPVFEQMEMRAYPANREDQAWAWLGATLE